VSLQYASEVERIVFIWSFLYRFATFLTIFFGPALFYRGSQEFWTSRDYWTDLSQAIIRQSPVFIGFCLNNGFLQGGLALSQIVRNILHFFSMIFVKPEARSKRSLQRLDQPVYIAYGNICPPFLFPFLTAILFSVLVPLASGMASINFYLNAKIYTHQALFVYTQPYESGGNMMYKFTTSLFVTLYLGIFVLAFYMSVNQAIAPSAVFSLATSVATVQTHRMILAKFIWPSQVQPYTFARLIDEENQKKKLNKSREAAVGEERRTRLYSQETDDEKIWPRMDIRKQKGTTFSLTKNEGMEEQQDDKLERDIDDGTCRLLRRYSSRFVPGLVEEQEFFAYRQPELNKTLWETEPQPYRPVMTQS